MFTFEHIPVDHDLKVISIGLLWVWERVLGDPDKNDAVWTRTITAIHTSILQVKLM